MHRNDDRVVVQIPPWKQEELNCSAGMSEGNNLCWRDMNAVMNYSVIVCTFEVPSIISLNFSFDTSETYLIENKPFIELPALQNGCDLCAREAGDIQWEQTQINFIEWGYGSASTNMTWMQRKKDKVNELSFI